MKITGFTSFFILATSVLGQEVVVDWAAKKVISQPAVVEKTVFANVRLENINDMMFIYSVSYQLKPVEISDFSTIAKAFSIAGKAAAGEAVGCEISDVLDTQKALSDAEAIFLKAPVTNKGCSDSKPCDVPLQQALTNWDSDVQPRIGAAQTKLDEFTRLCPSQSYSAAVIVAREAINRAVNKRAGPHSVIKPSGIQLSPDMVTSMEVDQTYMGLLTTNGSYKVDLQPSNRRLTLSAGALFSEIQNRSYTSQSAPSASGTSTSNVLSVSGLSKFSPTALALLNYEIPYLDWERAGFALSTGPVFRLGSKSDTSSFGYFAGLSFHLFHRFYFTPGYHFGQFADFPAGFSQVNQPVPPGLATPSPVTRWTWRFGFGLSYKAKDFSQFGLAGSVTPTPKSQGK